MHIDLLIECRMIMREHIDDFDIHIGRQLRPRATSPSCTVLLLFLALVIVHQTECLFVHIRMQSGIVVRRETVVNEAVDELSLADERGPEHSDAVSPHFLRLLTLAS